MTPCLLIAGPTAAGKTALSISAAERLGGEIINADSMQVYAGLPLITAQPDADDRARVPHHLFGTIDPQVRYSVGQWTRDALARIEACRGRGRVPVLVGGTGLYFNALVRGLAPVPAIGEAARARTAALLEIAGLSGLRAEALRLDPVAASRVEAADRQRLMRIVEVVFETGRPLSEFQADTVPPLPGCAWRGIVIEPDREALYARIDRRFDRMLELGALDEVSAFAARGVDPDLPASKALGVPQLMAHLRGEMTLEAAAALAKRDSRRYAKRQGTWFRNQAASWARITSLDPVVARDALAAILEGDAR
ncbi:tRNA (adenosine(37)-N6)-dimethylallyltransferase MiaA [Maricaulis sp.]|uniref:tRNA (adenosine(37)-N6)-dimethylallyltransferase MiaA n=1 Tax=Maricaulis sp. TaxID=1486257 RepID=UPI0025C24DBE|nr:tRNA (adenosine(37)-N6)-dimethylallyltransferase MiaA [Maricaulis sp.]